MERYLNGFKRNDGLWQPYIPVAFHVDYWDYIGWKDRFASAEFAHRQRRHAREGNVRSVYTPALILNGKAWRPGLFGQMPQTPSRPVGELEVRVEGTTLNAAFKPATDTAPALQLHIALLGMGLESRITAGENKGRTSQHEFVVIGFKSVPGNHGYWQTELPELHTPDTVARALAVWLSPPDSLKPLQAVGGYLEGAEISQGPQ